MAPTPPSPSPPNTLDERITIHYESDPQAPASTEHDVELQGLLSGQPDPSLPRFSYTTTAKPQQQKEGRWLDFSTWFDDITSWSPWSWHDDRDRNYRRRHWQQRLSIVVAGLMVFLLGTSVVRPLIDHCGTGGDSWRGSGKHPNEDFKGAVLRSNGTHEFKRTVLLVSIDGLRADYLDRRLTPHLLDISEKGIRAKSMKPTFPTLTFPNHWTLLTGLYAESHGMVANDFYDPTLNAEFHIHQEDAHSNPAWWFGEPMWETAGKAGLITANLMWPGPWRTSTGASSTYLVHFKDHTPLNEKLDQILAWIDLPLEQRPQLILAYEPTLDQAGHKAGPNSELVNATLKQVDEFARDLHTQIAARNLTDIVDVVFVSDHGMTDTNFTELIYLDDIIGKDGIACIEHEDGWPNKGLHFSPICNSSHYITLLLSAAKENSHKFHVYTRETMPKRYHFSNHYRIAPVYIVSELGHVITTEAEGDTDMVKGNHGYDNKEESMQAVFIAHGPLADNLKGSPKKSHDKWHSVEGSVHVMRKFENVEIYGLMMKLFGIENWAAPNNGTEGFWDRYF